MHAPHHAAKLVADTASIACMLSNSTKTMRCHMIMLVYMTCQCCLQVMAIKDIMTTAHTVALLLEASQVLALLRDCQSGRMMVLPETQIGRCRLHRWYPSSLQPQAHLVLLPAQHSIQKLLIVSSLPSKWMCAKQSLVKVCKATLARGSKPGQICISQEPAEVVREQAQLELLPCQVRPDLLNRSTSLFTTAYM